MEIISHNFIFLFIIINVFLIIGGIKIMLCYWQMRKKTISPIYGIVNIKMFFDILKTKTITKSTKLKDRIHMNSVFVKGSSINPYLII